MKVIFVDREAAKHNTDETEESQNLNTETVENDKNQTDAELQPRKGLGKQIREKSWFGKKCVKIFRVFSNTFAMTFLAEWGDRSCVYILPKKTSISPHCDQSFPPKYQSSLLLAKNSLKSWKSCREIDIFRRFIPKFTI